MRRFFVIVFALLAFSLRVQASGQLNFVFLCNDPPPSGPGGPCPDYLPGTGPTAGPVSFSSVVVGTFPDGTTVRASLDARADATGGILRAYNAYANTDPVSGQPTSIPFFGNDESFASFLDLLTITASGIPTGTIGYLTPRYEVTGTLQGSAFAALTLTGSFPTQTHSLSSGTTSIQFNPIAFTFGAPFTFDEQLLAGTRFGPGNTGGVSDFGGTAILNLLGVYADSGLTTPISDAQFTSDAGLTYTSQGISVLEPPSILYLLIGLATLFGIKIARCNAPQV